MIRRILLFLAICWSCQPVFACNEAGYKEGQKYANSDPMMLDRATIFSVDGKLEPLFTRCYKDDTCVYVQAGCGGAAAVNKASEQIILSVFQEISAHTNCIAAPREDSKSIPVKCINNLCTIVNSAFK